MSLGGLVPAPVPGMETRRLYLIPKSVLDEKFPCFVSFYIIRTQLFSLGR